MRQDPADDRVSGGGFGGFGKVTPPSLSRVHPNDRLFARLDGAFEKPVVWVQGQPGAGKTTLVASYLAARSVAPLWYRLDEGDADPATLFFYLAEAARRTRLPGAPGLQRLTPEHRAGTGMFARRFFRDLFEGGASAVVFDDYHEVAAGAALHDFLPQALEEIPAGRHVVIVSRGVPPGQLARLRLNGMIELVGGDALRMSVEEASGLARERGAAVDPASIERLVGRTQGWAAGLVLMLEAAVGADMPAVPEGEAASEVLFDYFAGEVFGRMTLRARRLLAAVALMPDATAASAVELTGEGDAAAVLEDLRRRNYFTTRDVQAEPRYRFHPLFRDFLLAGAAELFSPRELTALRARAAAILEAESQPEPAAALLAEAGASEELAALVRRWAARLIKEGRNDTLTGWLAKLPAALVEREGWLSYWRGVARLYFHVDDVLPDLARASRLFREAGDVDGEFMAWGHTAAYYRTDAFGDMTAFDGLIEQLGELLARHPDIPSPEIELLVSLGMSTALLRRSADRKAVAFWHQRARDAAKAVPGRGHVELAGFVSVIGEITDAKFAEAVTRLDSLPDPMTLDHMPLVQASGLIAHVMAILHRQKAVDCSAYVEQAIRCLTASGRIRWLPFMAGMGAQDALQRGAAAEAEIWLRRLAEYADAAASDRGVFFHIAASQLRLLQGQVGTATAHAEAAIDIRRKTGWYFFETFGRLSRTEALIEARRFVEAEAELGRLDELIATSVSGSCAFYAALLRVEVRAALDGPAARAAHLAEAMALGRSQGAMRGYVSAPRLARLLGDALRLGIERDYVKTVIRRLGVMAPDHHDEIWPWPVAIRTLGAFEVVQDGRPLAFSRKTPKRLVTLIKAIAAFGGTDAPEAQVIDAVWPDEDGDAGRQSFKVAVHRLRQLLGDAEALVVKGGRIGFDPSRCWLDIRAFEHLTAPRAASETIDDFDARQSRAVALYRADFLAGEGELYWAEPRRVHLRSRFVRAVCETAERRAERGDCQDAVATYRRAMEIAPESEEICQALMRRCLVAGRSAEGLSAYGRLRAALDESSGAAPAAATDALHRKLATM